MFVANIGAGMAASFTILAILAIANAGTSWIANGSTLTEMIERKTGLNTSGVA